jgi:GNAT superfamily N-acetyltransferase
LARVYVAFLREQLVGYYWLVTQSHPPKKISEDDHIVFGKIEFVPCVYLGMLAIQKEFQGGGIGKTLMLHAFEKTLEIADRAGVYALTLEAVDEKTAKRYEGWGFQRFFDGKLLLFIPVATIQRAFPLVPPAAFRRFFSNIFAFARR